PVLQTLTCSEEAINSGVNKSLQEDFQKKVLAEIRISKANLEEQKLWGLFSAGGWSDGGQFLVLEDRKSAQLQLFYRAAGRREIVKHALSLEKAALFKTNITNLLKDTSHLCRSVFDAVNYEVIVAGIDKNEKFLISKTILMQAPQVDPVSSKHVELIKVFESLLVSN
ncbi:MAG: hypothetical protein KBD78_10270, partial [Oligoflexales bacterium]|nr:hypothetical protein [Oligoflexales bacterium]